MLASKREGNDGDGTRKRSGGLSSTSAQSTLVTI